MQDFTDADFIAFAGLRFNHKGQQETAIGREFRMTATRFWQRVNQVLDDPERIRALEPELWPIVRRQIELRAERLEQRSPRRRAS